MRVWIALMSLLILSAGSVRALELVGNGDFEQDLNMAWEQNIIGSPATIDRATHYQPDPDYEARAWHGTGTGEARLYQVIPVPGVDLDFSVEAKILATATSTAWSAAGIIVAYLDQYDFMLGETCICQRSTYCPWSNGATTHLIDAPPSLWRLHEFNLADELTNLPGIDPLEVKKIQISLLAVTHDC